MTTACTLAPVRLCVFTALALGLPGICDTSSSAVYLTPSRDASLNVLHVLEEFGRGVPELVESLLADVEGMLTAVAQRTLHRELRPQDAVQ
eukprot:CAMPEP_0174735210 /NCGR_PEP_ID=MMETSP1094-20130205/64573_1 /TAXON_ID=156173 /ORGANISM="Chrysochromulina brevifilum, Strain UTEX LB 985" /LENGTH=90 /DNA_ID=CAMNT_0015938143 /DNA_START=255 /DNA_END=528 /DNA_ORIENTATION=+